MSLDMTQKITWEIAQISVDLPFFIHVILFKKDIFSCIQNKSKNRQNLEIQIFHTVPNMEILFVNSFCL